MKTRVMGVVAIVVAAALWMTTGGALLAAAQGSSPVGGASGPTPTIACEVVNGTCTYMISGRVYYDLNGNGVKDASEADIPGVDVDLYMGATAAGTPIASDTTASPYMFDQLQPGTYTVLVDQSDLPEGCTPTADFDGGTWGTATVVINQSGEIFADFGCTPAVEGVLAFTGGSQGILALVGGSMMILGTGAFVARRRLETALESAA